MQSSVFLSLSSNWLKRHIMYLQIPAIAPHLNKPSISGNLQWPWVKCCHRLAFHEVRRLSGARVSEFTFIFIYLYNIILYLLIYSLQIVEACHDVEHKWKIDTLVTVLSKKLNLLSCIPFVHQNLIIHTRARFTDVVHVLDQHHFVLSGHMRRDRTTYC